MRGHCLCARMPLGLRAARTGAHVDWLSADRVEPSTRAQSVPLVQPAHLRLELSPARAEMTRYAALHTELKTWWARVASGPLQHCDCLTVACSSVHQGSPPSLAWHSQHRLCVCASVCATGPSPCGVDLAALEHALAWTMSTAQSGFDALSARMCLPTGTPFCTAHRAAVTSSVCPCRVPARLLAGILRVQLTAGDSQASVLAYQHTALTALSYYTVPQVARAHTATCAAVAFPMACCISNTITPWRLYQALRTVPAPAYRARQLATRAHPSRCSADPSTQPTLRA